MQWRINTASRERGQKGIVRKGMSPPTGPATLKLTTPKDGHLDHLVVQEKVMSDVCVLGEKCHILTWYGRSVLSVDDGREFGVSDGGQTNHRGCEPDTSRRSVVLLGLLQTSQGRQHVLGFGRRAETYFGQLLEDTWFENA